MEPVTASTAGIRTAFAAATAYIQLRRRIERHNRQAERIYEDLTSWVKDEDRELQRELLKIDNDLNARNLFYSGERLHQRKLAKEHRLHRLRDRRRAAERAIEDLVAEESRLHRWRRTRLHLPWPEDSGRDELELIRARWREDEGGGEFPIVKVEEPD